MWVWLFHLLFVFPLLIYLWLSTQFYKKQPPNYIYDAILVIAVIGIFYHGSRLISYLIR